MSIIMYATLHDATPNTYYGQWPGRKPRFSGLESPSIAHNELVAGAGVATFGVAARDFPENRSPRRWKFVCRPKQNLCAWRGALPAATTPLGRCTRHLDVRGVPRGPPGGRAQQGGDYLAPRPNPAQIAGKLEPLMEGNPDRIVGEQRCRQSVPARQIAAFGDEGAEQSIEHDQHPAVVGVDIVGIRGVVD